MARSAGNKEKDIESLKHREARRKNIPTTELESLVSEDEQAPKPIRWKRNTDLDPQLVWRGKDEQDTEDLMVELGADLHPGKDPAGSNHPQSVTRSPIQMRSAVSGLLPTKRRSRRRWSGHGRSGWSSYIPPNAARWSVISTGRHGSRALPGPARAWWQCTAPPIWPACRRADGCC